MEVKKFFIFSIVGVFFTSYAIADHKFTITIKNNSNFPLVIKTHHNCTNNPGPSKQSLEPSESITTPSNINLYTGGDCSGGNKNRYFRYEVYILGISTVICSAGFQANGFYKNPMKWFWHNKSTYCKQNPTTCNGTSCKIIFNPRTN